jgi:hypothetical protein
MQQAPTSPAPSTSTWTKITKAIKATLMRTSQCPQSPTAPKIGHQPQGHQPQDHLPLPRSTNHPDLQNTTSTPMEGGDPRQTGLLGRLYHFQKSRRTRNHGHTPPSDISPQSLRVPSLSQQACQWLHRETLRHHRQVQALIPRLRQNIRALTRHHPRSTLRHRNCLPPPPLGIWLGPAVRPSSIIGQPPLFETPAKPSSSASPPQSPTPPSRSNLCANIRPSSWGVKYPQPSQEQHPNRWLECVPTRTVGSITCGNKSENAGAPNHPMMRQSDTRRPHPRPPPHPPLASPSPSTPPEWDYLASRYNPPPSLHHMRPPPTPPNTPCPN